VFLWLRLLTGLMVIQVFPIVVVDGWEVAGEEQLGSKPKRWLKDPKTGELWLLKDVTFSKPKVGASYAKGDDWSERIASAIAQFMGLPAARTELATYGDDDPRPDGVVSHKIHSDNEQLEHGDVLLAETGVAVSRRSRDGYTLDAIRRALQAGDNGGIDPPNSGPMSAWEIFVGYLVLDALIGNTDRHEENWAAVSGREGRRLAPTYDHASSLGFQLADSQRQERLITNDDGYSVEAYARRARSQYADRPSPHDVACDGLRPYLT